MVKLNPSSFSPSSSCSVGALANSTKSRFCFICATGLSNYSQTEDDDDEEENASASLEVFLKGVDVFCGALQLERKPFNRSDDWKRFAALDKFVRHICCSKCSKRLISLVSLHELILKTEVNTKIISNQFHFDYFCVECQIECNGWIID